MVEQATPVEWLRRRRRSVCSKFPLVRLVLGRNDFAMFIAGLLWVGDNGVLTETEQPQPGDTEKVSGSKEVDAR